MYNSSVGFKRDDDDDGTMTSPPYLNNQATVEMPVLNRPYSRSESNHDRKDYVYVDQDSLETAKQLERILKYYQRELKQEANSQSYCDQQLITRLIDFIRPTYSTNEVKLRELDDLFEDIATIHDVRLIEQKEKTEQFQNEIAHLKKVIITSANDDDRRNNSATQIYRLTSMNNYDQWKEMEDETKKLQNLVEIQRDRINELVTLLSKEGPLTSRAAASTTLIAPFDTASTNNQRLTASDSNAESSLVARVRALIDQQPNADNQNGDRSTVTTRTLPLISRISSYNHNNNTRNCFICNHEFLSSANEFQIISHVEKCLLSAGINDVNVPNEPKQYECPNCKRQYPGDEEKAYIEHLSDCFSQLVENF